MDEQTELDIIAKLDIPTKDLHLEVIQEVLHRARTCRAKQNKSSSWNRILNLLWEHLQSGFRKFDDQLLCSVCFHTILEFTTEKEFYLKKVLTLIKTELCLRDETKNYKDSSGKMRTSHVVSLMYGLLQSKCAVHICYKEVPIVVDVLNSSLELLILMAYEYSRYTFIVFKTISSFKIVCDPELQRILFYSNSGNNFMKLKNLTNHNWENPITGVRDLNKAVFQIVISICNNVDGILCDIKDFYWNKAKYLMLAEIIEQKDYSALRNSWSEPKDCWIDGLVYSLSKPGIVSAGADMYYAVLKKIRSEDEWCNLFLSVIINTLHGSSSKAVENFSNYWCLTTFKKFPGLSKVLIEELEKLEESETKLYSCLCILKQANKLGLLNKSWNVDDYGITEQKVLDGIEHSNTNIRMLAFEILSVSLGKAMPSVKEYDLILNYLHNNVNSDCSVLRISMLGSNKYFLTHLCASHTNYTKHNQQCETDNLLNFYRSLQEFIIDSLSLDGNYQRKITTIKLCNILLCSLKDVTKKRQKQTTTSGTAMINFLKDNDCLILFNEKFLLKLFELLKDPADDIRETIVQLLLDHYAKEITAPLLSKLIEDATGCVRSKFFFEISCGQSMFRLITSLLQKGNYTDTLFTNIDDVFGFAYDVLNEEYELKRDIVKSIVNGKQLHAYLNVLQEVLKVSKLLSYEIGTLRKILPQILNILEYISGQFAWEEEPTVSSDFSKMSDMVQNIIASSGYNPLDDKDSAKISGLQQMVLNCLWLNVKASCDFASYLVSLFAADSDAEACRRCLGVITHVLETSRHKGAIEAAGAALGRAVQHLTSLPEGSALAGLPRALLETKLEELIHLAAASVTRRGAGLSIMVHRIVSSDMEKGKPLFHYFMATLLECCHCEVAGEDDGQRDVPRAVYIHSLTRVVTDSGLASDMMYYSADLAEVAFDNLTSPHWQIRNAALQLYGALIPKLIGQKKASGVDDETAATVAIDEFASHAPRLWRRMTRGLHALDHAHALQAHSDALPVLNVLANLARRYDVSKHPTFTSATPLLQSLILLLGSPIYTVRRLTAKCIFNLYSFSIANEEIMRLEFRCENFIHGCLLLFKYYEKNLQNDQSNKVFEVMFKKFRRTVSKGNCSYVTKSEYGSFSEYELWNEFYSQQYVQDVLSETRQNRYLAGVHQWANNKVEKCIKFCKCEIIPNILKVILEDNDFEKYCGFILAKLKISREIPKNIMFEITEILLMFKKRFQSSVVWEILYHISEKTRNSNIDMSIFEYVEIDVPYRIRYAIPFLASVADKIPEEHLRKLSNIILTLCDPDKSDVDMRHIAALANNELAHNFFKISDSVRICGIKCAVLLLQDEDEDVRMVNVHFYSNITKDNIMLQPYVCLSKILNKHFLESCFDDPHKMIPLLCEELSENLVIYAKSGDIDEYNPFSNDSKNIYFESEVVKRLLQQVNN